MPRIRASSARVANIRVERDTSGAESARVKRWTIAIGSHDDDALASEAIFRLHKFGVFLFFYNDLKFPAVFRADYSTADFLTRRMRFVGVDDQVIVNIDDMYRHRKLEWGALSKSTPHGPLASGTVDGSGFAASREGEPAKDSVAVALQSDPDKPDSVPRVVATGRGEFAEIILDIAFRNGIKVRRDADLAEILATVDLDSEVPVEAIIAVAEILRYVYRANQTGPPEPDGSASPTS